MVMTVALLIYAIAQKRLRDALVKQNETIPNRPQRTSVLENRKFCGKTELGSYIRFTPVSYREVRAD